MNFILVGGVQTGQSLDTSGTLQVTSTQPSGSPTNLQLKKKYEDVPGSARALSTALEQKMEGNLSALPQCKVNNI